MNIYVIYFNKINGNIIALCKLFFIVKCYRYILLLWVYCVFNFIIGVLFCIKKIYWFGWDIGI